MCYLGKDDKSLNDVREMLIWRDERVFGVGKELESAERRSWHLTAPLLRKYEKANDEFSAFPLNDRRAGFRVIRMVAEEYAKLVVQMDDAVPKKIWNLRTAPVEWLVNDDVVLVVEPVTEVYTAAEYLGQREASPEDVHDNWPPLMQAWWLAHQPSTFHTEDVYSKICPYPWQEHDEMLAGLEEDIAARKSESPRMLDRVRDYISLFRRGTSMNCRWPVLYRRLINISGERIAEGVQARHPEDGDSDGNYIHMWRYPSGMISRHVWDLTSLIRVLARVWAVSAAFWDTLQHILTVMCMTQMCVERMVLTILWIFSSKHWPTIAVDVLGRDLLWLTTPEWIKVCKETTTVIIRSHTLPRTNLQSIVSRWYLNAENLVGYAQTMSRHDETLMPGVPADILDFKSAKHEYLAPDASGEMNFGSYVSAFAKHAEDIANELYVTPQPLSLVGFLGDRSRWGTSGAAGRKLRDTFGAKTVPSGAARGYAMSRLTTNEILEHMSDTTIIEVAAKQDEKGAFRGLGATDAWDQFAEVYLFRGYRNNWHKIGLDVAEDRYQELARMLIVQEWSRIKNHNILDNLLSAYDYKGFDHWVLNIEQTLVLEALFKRAVVDCNDELHTDLKVCFDKALSKFRDVIVRNWHIDEDMCGERAEFLGDGKARVLNAAGQDSGRALTMDANTFVSAVRCRIRDEILPAQYRPVFTLNRSDDILEGVSTWASGRALIETFSAMAMKANPKKQVIQRSNGVYFRLLYADGGIGAFPARSIYSVLMRAPAKTAGDASNAYDKMDDLSDACSRAVRRGWCADLASYAWYEATEYYRRVSYVRNDGEIDNYYVSRGALAASPHSGDGKGIVPPGATHFGKGRVEYMPRSGQKDRVRMLHIQRTERKKLIGVDQMVESVAAVAEEMGQVRVEAAIERTKQQWCDARATQRGDGALLQIKRREAAARHPMIKKGVAACVTLRAMEMIDLQAALSRAFNQVASAIDKCKRSTSVIDSATTLKESASPSGAGYLKNLWAGYASQIYVEEGSTLNSLLRLMNYNERGKRILDELGECPHAFLHEWLLDGVPIDAPVANCLPPHGCSYHKWSYELTMYSLRGYASDRDVWIAMRRIASEALLEGWLGNCESWTTLSEFLY